MAICEKCGTRYAPTATTPECPKCAPAPRKSAAATATATPRPKKKAPEPEHHHVEVHHREGPEPLMDNATKIGLGIAGGLLVIVGIVVVVVKGKKDDERAAAEAHDNEVKAIFAEVDKATKSGVEAELEAAVKKADETEKTWRDHNLAADITRKRASAKTTLQANKDRRVVIDQFTKLEADLKNPAAIPPERIKDMRRQLEEMTLKISGAGIEIEGRHALVLRSATQIYATRLAEDAKQVADTGGEAARLGLIRCATAEDELKLMMDEALRAKNTELAGSYTGLYQQTIDATNQIVAGIFTKSEIEKLPWVDCLSGGQASKWNPANAKGFSWRVDKGTLQLVGPDPDSGKDGIIAIGDAEQWRNLMVDAEFTIEKGGIDLYFRLGRNPNFQTPMFALRAEGKNQKLRLGKRYRCTFTLIGHEFSARWEEEDIDTPNSEETFDWKMNRKGAVGILVPIGARVKFTRFQVRELR